MSAIPSASTLDRAQNVAKKAVVWLFIATLAWSAFPLGGAIAWAAGLQEMAIAFCWVLWVIATASSSKGETTVSRAVVIPLVLASLALCWAVVQSLPGVPANWVHPVWPMAADALGAPLSGTISLNPWRTEAEVLKLGSYIMAGWLVFRMSRRAETASTILNAVIAICAVYATYAFVLELSGIQQTKVFYSVPYHGLYLSGPFMLHNSFATFTGMGVVAATVKLFAVGSRQMVLGRGARRYIESILHYCFGRGAPLLFAVLITLGAVVASVSRAGFVATLCGLLVVAVVSIRLVRGRMTAWTAVGALVVVAPLLIIVVFSGDTLASRVGQLFASDAGDVIRPVLWAAARRMIADAPVLGLGLGTFEDAYPMYAVKIFPLVMDKAHSDYLEFAAGIGLPAAVAWLTALAWSTVLCIRAVFVRQRNRLYSVTAVGASVLVAVHSSVDFSLQLPAVALLYATLLGLGVAQCESSRS